MLPLFLILYGGDDDTYGGSQYGAGSGSSGYESQYSVDILSYGDGGVGSYVDSLLDGPVYDDGDSVYGGQDPYDGGGSYGGLLNLSIPYLDSYEPQYGL